MFVTKRDINPFTIYLFKEKLLKVDWRLLHPIKDPNEAYKKILNVFSNLYEIAFPKLKIKVNSIPWITRGILKSSKRMQKLYEKCMKNINSVNKENYKTFARLFELIKQNSKKNYYGNLLITYENDMKRTWVTIKKIIRSKQSSGSLFPKRLILNDLEFFDKKTIAENFNKFFSKIGPKLASKIPHWLISFEDFLHGDYPSLEEKPITDDELKEALQTLKTKNSSGYDQIFSDVIKHISQSIFEPLRHIFNLSIGKGILSDQLKIGKVTPLFKKGDNALMDNYRPISVLPCFSNILERILYNKPYSFFSENNILYKKQFGFQKQHSTHHAIVYLVNEILKSCENNCYTLGVY